MMNCAVRVLLLSVGLINGTLGYCRASEENSNPIVTTPLGKVEGSVMKTRFGATISAFRGVPYARPPIDDLRFQPSEPVQPWKGVLNATENPPSCPQYGVKNTSENCLYLNIYHLQANKCDASKPVMVFFHPGGFYGGTISSNTFGPQYLLDQDIVLVVAAYRLGILGFLSTGTKDAPGNLGLKDQVLALKWIKENIASFCGDPNQVTITGYSAGAFSVTAHLVSPMSRGLFHKAISMSGSSFGNHPVPSDQLNLVKKQAELVGCPTNTTQGIISCLKSKDAQEIANSSIGFAVFLNNPLWLWGPVVEPDFGQEQFLVEHPGTSVLHDRFAKVPVIIGVTMDEFGGRSIGIVENTTALKEFDTDYKRLWPIIFAYQYNKTFSDGISEGLRKFYFPDGKIDKTKRQNIADLYADSLIGFGANRGAKILSEHNPGNVYYYRFSYVHRYSTFYRPGTNDTVPYGASHHDDLLYLFYIRELTPLFDKLPESVVVDNLTTLWGTFIKTGKPATSNVWPSFSLESQRFLDISYNLTIKDHLFDKRYKAWQDLFPLSLYS